MTRIRIDIEEVIALQKRRKEINNLDLSDIDFYKNGVKLDPKICSNDSLENIEEWKFTGLGIIDYVQIILLGDDV